MKRTEVGRRGGRKWGGGVREESERSGRGKRKKNMQVQLDNNVLPSTATTGRVSRTDSERGAVTSIGKRNAFVAICMLLGLLTSENCA